MTFRRGLLVGINDYPDMPLRGCINDVQLLSTQLHRRLGFADADIRILEDKSASRQAIVDGLGWLAEGPNDHDAVRVFHFSGHGSQQLDEDGDEPDGRDECLLPHDHTSAGVLTDDVLRDLFAQIPSASNLTLIMDCCHSGTINRGPGDLRFRFMPVPYELLERMEAAAETYQRLLRTFILQEFRRLAAEGAPPPENLEASAIALQRRFEQQHFGQARSRPGHVLISACTDQQQAADDFISRQFHGALTFMLCEAIEEANGIISHRDLIVAVRRKLAAEQYGQLPQLECELPVESRVAFSPMD